MLESYLLSVIRGERRKLSDRLVLLGLTLLEPIYAAIVILRSALYKAGVFHCHRLSVPVVSVGNLSAGGTGKTPLAIYLARRLAEMGRRPGVVIRGYRGKGEGARLVAGMLTVEDSGDEAQLLSRELPGIPVAVGADRYLSGSLAIGNGAETLILDDAFQHRGIGRDLDFVLLHAAQPWENGHLIPRGLLREGKTSLRRADLIILTGTDAVSEEAILNSAAEIRQICPDQPILRMFTRPVAVLALTEWWQGQNAGENAETFLQGKTIGAFTAIGRPEKFFNTLTSLGARIAHSWVRPDHAGWEGEEFSHSEINKDWLLLTTEKDAVKLKSFLKTPIVSRIYVLSIQAEFSDEDRQVLDKKLRELGE